MPKKQIRINMEDATGANYDIKLNGNITREKVLKLFEMMDLMNIEDDKELTKLDSKGAKIWNIIDKFYPIGKFTSTNILEKYEDEYNEPVKLSVISTYLSRFSTKGKTSRVRTGREWMYQTARMEQKHQQR